MSGAKRCRRCGAAVGKATRFCGSCGTATVGHSQAVRARASEGARQHGRHALVVAIVFIGTLTALIALELCTPVELEQGRRLWVGLALQVGVGLLAVLALARALRDEPTAPAEARVEARVGGAFSRAWRAALAGPAGGRDLALAPAVGALAFGVAWLWVLLLGGAVEADVEPLGALTVLAIVLGAPLVEEWMDRGLLWAALGPLTNERGRVVVSAALFAFAHGLGGGFALEFPHRFVGGLALGGLRARSGSLVPGVVAHMTWNALAVALVDL